MLSKRVISAAVLLPLVGVAVYLGGYWLAGAVALVACLAGIEYLALMRKLGQRPSTVLVLLGIVVCIAAAQWPAGGWGAHLMWAVPVALLVLEVWRGNREGALATWATSAAGVIYIGGSLAYVVRLRGMEPGLGWLALALVSTWISDTGAYFVGITWGKHRFFPAISPKKTLEGALGGLISGVVAVMLLGAWWVDLAPLPGLALGVLLVFAATFGDLAESIIKRQVGVKDSGSLIPGHGGMLDRVDSLLVVVPVVYLFVTGLGPLL